MTEIYDKNRMVVRTNIQQLNTLFTMGQELEGIVDGKQDKLIAGDGIIINGNVISVDGSGGGGGITVDDELSTESENPVQNKVITNALEDKQDVLTAGDNITIEDGVISATGGAGITVDSELSSESENPVQNKVITGALGDKLESTDISFTSTANIDRIRLTVDSTPSDVTLKTINGNHLIGSGDITVGSPAIVDNATVANIIQAFNDIGFDISNINNTKCVRFSGEGTIDGTTHSLYFDMYIDNWSTNTIQKISLGGWGTLKTSRNTTISDYVSYYVGWGDIWSGYTNWTTVPTDKFVVLYRTNSEYKYAIITKCVIEVY